MSSLSQIRMPKPKRHVAAAAASAAAKKRRDDDRALVTRASNAGNSSDHEKSPQHEDDVDAETKCSKEVELRPVPEALVWSADVPTTSRARYSGTSVRSQRRHKATVREAAKGMHTRLQLASSGRMDAKMRASVVMKRKAKEALSWTTFDAFLLDIEGCTRVESSNVECTHEEHHLRLSLYYFRIGTTTPISFVKDVLFPYARDHAEAYLEAHWVHEGLQLATDFRAQVR